MARLYSKNKKITSRRRTLLVAMSYVLIVLVIAGSGILSFKYINFFQQNMYAQNKFIISESAISIETQIETLATINQNIAKHIVNRIQILDKTENITEIKNHIQKEVDDWNIQELYIIDENKNWYNSMMESVAPLVIFEQKEGGGPQFFADQGGNLISLFSLAPPIEINNLRIIGIMVEKSHIDIPYLTQFKFLKGMARFYIAERSGKIIQKQNIQGQGDEQIYIQSFFENSTFSGSYSRDDVNTAIYSGQEVLIPFKKNNENLYFYSKAVHNSSLILFTIVPQNLLTSRYQTLFSMTIAVCGTMTSIFGCLIITLIYIKNKSEKQVRRLAFYDTLTGAPNLNKFEKTAENLFKKTQHNYAVVYLNIKKFKFVNEKHGKEAGDYILKSLYGDYIVPFLQDDEYAARIGPDNFGLLLTYNDKTDQVIQRLVKFQEKAEKIQDKNTGCLYSIQITFGIFFPKFRNSDIVSMLDKAHLALKMGDEKAVCNVFNTAINQKMLRDKILEDKMRDALTKSNFEVYYQPKISLKTGKATGAEALIRWRDPEDGLIMPGEFIPLFERNGFIIATDLFVFETICADIQRWLREGKTPPVVSFNLSKANIENPQFLNTYKNIIHHYGIPTKYIEFEFTETLMYDNLAILSKIIDEIHDIGATCSMDDFGSGYSSLNMLKNINVDVLKLDKEFFNEEETLSQKSKTVIKSVIELAQELNLHTISEGIEKQEDVLFLKDIGCDFIQGYYFAKPMPVKEFEAFMFPDN